MRIREARQLTRGEAIRPLASAIGYGTISRRYTYTVAYVGGLAFTPWIVTTEGLQFAPWEIERVDAQDAAWRRGTHPAPGAATRARKSGGGETAAGEGEEGKYRKD